MPTTLADRSPAAAPTALPRRLGRWGIGLNVFLQLVLAVGLVGLANWLAYRHYQRFDYSRDRKFALSERTKQFLGGMDKPVRMILFMAANAPLRGDVGDLLAEYRQAQPKFIQTETINPYADVSRAAELATKYKLGPEDNVVIVDCEGRQKLVAQDAMADVDRSGEPFGQAPTITAFKGEQALTGALLEVVEAKKNVVYYLRGQNEPELGPRGPLTNVQQTLERDNVQLKELNLANVAAGTGVPADASAVFLAGARYDLSEPEVKALEDYWNKQGRLFILLNPDAPTVRLAAFLERTGIRADDDRLTAIARVSLPGGEPVLRRVNGVLGEAASDHPVVRTLKGVNFTVPGATQSLSLDAARVRAANVQLTPLVKAQEGFWGEADYRGEVANDPAASRFDEGRDKKDNLVYAACAERGAVAEGRVSVPSARLVVVANVRFIEDGSTTQEMADFFRNALNWLLDRDRLIGIPPKEVKSFTLNVPDQQVNVLFLLTIIVIPAAAALAGACVWFVRRA